MGFDGSVSRKSFLTASLAAAFAPFDALAQGAGPQKYAIGDIKGAEKLAGITLTDAQRKAVVDGLNNSRTALDAIREQGLPNELSPAFQFVPHGKKPQPGTKTSLKLDSVRGLKKPAYEDIAFLTVAELGQLLRSKQVTSVELTQMYLDRIKQFAPKLKNCITVTTQLAMSLAERADDEIKRGKWRGPLHGIPFGIKDLFAAKGYPTTWGAEPYKDQQLNYDSAVVEKLIEAGAVLVAKTSVGALAYGDLWFGGLTLNPWNPKQGSSGSSAGSSSGMAAGLFAFAIGTETLGSIISPTQRCRVTGLRPTFGRVSRYGAMALSWTMDKVGPICRTAEDCAIVFSVIHGADERDNCSVSYPFEYNSKIDLSKLKIGVMATAGFDEDDVSKEIGVAGEVLRALGATFTQIKISPTPQGIDEVLSIEAAAAFDTITRNGKVDTMKGSLWPPIFRASSFLTGVDYIQAMRMRSTLMKRFEEELADFDLVVLPERGGDVLVTTNLTGHPQIFVPMGVNEAGRPIGVSLVGRLYQEATLLAVANMMQKKTRFYRERPDLSKLPA